jgi:hypothetical protein
MRFNHFGILRSALLLALAPAALGSTTWYVNGVSGSDSNNCMSATSACKTVGHAISLASSGDTIMVAPATYTENLTISISLKVIGSGASTTIIDGGFSGTVVTIFNTSSVTLSKLTIRNGRAQYGAGVYRITNAGALSIISTVITGNRAAGCQGSYGGGITNSGTLTISNSTIKGNSAVATCTGGSATGGGVANNIGTLTITKSTISGNSVSAAGCAQIGRTCTGGVASGGGISTPSTLNIADSTISGNATSAHCVLSGRCRAVGGGIAITNVGGAMTIASSTLAGNSATCSGSCAAAGGGIDNIGTATIQNSIVANSSNGNCEGTITSNGYNLSSDGTCNFTHTGDLNNTDPMLGPLQYNGGPTQTMALPSGSPAVDAGNPNGCTDNLGHLLKTDQRGKPRPDAEETAGCDIGAYEYQGALQGGHCVYVCGSTRCGMLTGYCAGSVNGACRRTYDPAQCPVGQPAGGSGSSCGEAIDTTRTCTP